MSGGGSHSLSARGGTRLSSEVFRLIGPRFSSDSVRKLFTVQVVQEEDVDRIEESRSRQRMTMSHGAISEAGGKASPAQSNKVGRNDPCPCGSGKKYKKCHGR